jgi:predicted GH43/DUF377 family glycosyl hydrolase
MRQVSPVDAGPIVARWEAAGIVRQRLEQLCHKGIAAKRKMIDTGPDFSVTRLGVIMSPQAGEPQETWGILNPGGVRAHDGTLHLFPRLVAEGNYSRIGRARVCFEGERPVRAERLGIALEPHASYELSPLGGGVEDARVVYVPLLKRYVMTYTAFVPYEPRAAIAVSEDLQAWHRLGALSYEIMPDGSDLNKCGNKDAAFFPDVVSDPEGIPSFGILHRPTTRLHFSRVDSALVVTTPPSGEETQENIWISYIPVDAALADIGKLTSVRRHEQVMAPEQPWEAKKVGAGAPPVRLPYGWVVPYHGVCALEGHLRYCMGVAILDGERPSRVLYRTALPILEPQAQYECNGLDKDVVFPSASDLHADGTLDVYYGAADRVIAAARITLPKRLPTHQHGSSRDID